MKEISINCAGLTDEAAVYALVARNFGLEDHGENSLDALYDCLIAISQETHVTIFGLNNPEFGEGLRNILQDAEADNFWLSISIQ